MKTHSQILVLSLVLLLIVSVGFSRGLKTFAQQSIPSLAGFEEQIELKVTPLNPQPGDEIKASVEAFGTDLNKATISWFINKLPQVSGVGITSFATKALPLGKIMTISADIKTEAGDRVTKSFTLSSQDVDIIWEANSYSPPFYKGKPLYGEEGNVTFVAMPNIINKAGQRVVPSNLIYKWIVDETVLGSKSGYGKNTLAFTGPLLGVNTVVEVDVTAFDGTTGHGIVVVEPRTPRSILYENNPYYGVLFNNAVTNGFKLRDKEIRIDAYPYSFSALSKNASNISYSWSINDQQIPVPISKNSVVLRNSSGLSGASKISVTTGNSSYILQQSRTDVSLNF